MPSRNHPHAGAAALDEAGAALGICTLAHPVSSSAQIGPRVDFLNQAEAAEGVHLPLILDLATEVPEVANAANTHSPLASCQQLMTYLLGVAWRRRNYKSREMNQLINAGCIVGRRDNDKSTSPGLKTSNKPNDHHAGTNNNPLVFHIGMDRLCSWDSSRSLLLPSVKIHNNCHIQHQIFFNSWQKTTN